MKADAFRKWLTTNYSPASANTHFSCAKRVDETYGDLDQKYDDGSIEDLINHLHYSKSDEKAALPNPTKLQISGNPYNVLNNFKAAVRCYKSFIEAGGEGEIFAETVVEKAVSIVKENEASKQFDLERNLQDALRAEIEQLEPGLKIVDNGQEFSVNSGNIDILAEDVSGYAVVIELKRGMAKRDAIGQITGYMGDLIDHEGYDKVRGILVAAKFDKSCQSAVNVIPNLRLLEYRFKFSFCSPAAA